MNWKTRLLLPCWRLEDNLRYSRIFRAGRAWLHWMRGLLSGDPLEKTRRLALAFGLAESSRMQRLLGPKVRLVLKGLQQPVWQRVVQTTPRYIGLLKTSPHLTRTVVLKEPGAAGEKGVIFTYFEYNLARILQAKPEDLKWLSDRYEVIFAASWSPTDYALLGAAAESLTDGLWVQPATEPERQRITAFHPKLRCVPGLACDWVDDALYQTKPWAERSIDLLMVANWGAFKRHWDFFSVLRSLPEGLRVVLVGQKEGGRCREDMERLAREMGVPQQLDWRESLTVEEVATLQCDSKVAVVMSRREGGCVAIAEALMAGCTIAMRADASIGSAAYVNDQTGVLLHPGRTAEGLKGLLERGSAMNPGRWARENISCTKSLRAVEKALEEHAGASGRGWTHGLAGFHYQPYPVISSSYDCERLQPIYNELHTRMPDIFPVDLVSTSRR